MKTIALLTALAIAVTPAFSAETRKPPAKRTERAKKKADSKKPDAKKPAPQQTDMIDEDVVALLKPYDLNSDFEIDIEEFKALEAAFKKSPKGPLKQFDKARDGVIDAMIDRTGINVKLGSAAPKNGSTPALAPAPAKKSEPAPPPPVPPKSPEAPKPPAKPEANKKPA